MRAGLDDLTTEQRDELLDGLAADLTEQLADGAEGLLADPAAYAAELRAAAGLPEQRRSGQPRPKLPTRQRIEAILDRARDAWRRRVGDTLAGEVLESLRPAWWVVRAWVAVTLLDRATGSYEPVSLLPSFGVPILGAAILAVAIVGSVLIGITAWPGAGRPGPCVARLTLITLNVGALLVPLSFGISGPGYLSGTSVRGLRVLRLQPGLRRCLPGVRRRAAHQRRSGAQHLRVRRLGAAAARRSALRPKRPASGAGREPDPAGPGGHSAGGLSVAERDERRSTTCSRSPSGSRSMARASRPMAPAASDRSRSRRRRSRKCRR